MKNQKGITLAALVVTIVVLLILAGITIAFVLSDDGIFATAKDAKIKSEQGTISDYAGLAQATYLVETYDPNKEADAKSAVTNNFPNGYIVNANGISGENGLLSGTATVTSPKVTGYTFTVKYADGVATVTYEKIN